MHKHSSQPNEEFEGDVKIADVVGFYKQMITTVKQPSEPVEEKSLDGGHMD